MPYCSEYLHSGIGKKKHFFLLKKFSMQKLFFDTNTFHFSSISKRQTFVPKLTNTRQTTVPTSEGGIQPPFTYFHGYNTDISPPMVSTEILRNFPLFLPNPYLFRSKGVS